VLISLGILLDRTFDRSSVFRDHTDGVDELLKRLPIGELPLLTKRGFASDSGSGEGDDKGEASR
jgi:hypothetical protein